MEWAQVHTQGMMAKKISKIGRLSLLVALRRMVMSFREILLPLFVLNILLLDEAFYGLMVAAAGYMQSGALFPAGWISDRRGRGFAILVGGVFGGSCLLLIPFAGSWFLTFILYAMTGIGAGFTMTSIDTLIADYSKRGDEMTKSYGYTRTIAVLTAVLGPLLAGFILDPSALPGINPIMLRYSIVFFIMGSLNIAAGVTGFFTERWLIANLPESEREENECVREDESERRQDVETALLFGVSRMLMGFSSGMVIPYLIPWIYEAFMPDPLILGSIPAISNLTLASGTLFVGLSSERVGKLRMIGLLYLVVPILTLGMVWIPFFLGMVVFYVARNMVANMAQPASDSLFMQEIGSHRRARSLALTRIMWTFPRQTGTLLTAILLGSGFLGGIVTLGIIVFPIAMFLYPICVVPMFFAVRRNSNRNLNEQSQSSAN